MGYYFLKDIQYSPRLVSFEVENELRYLNPDRINVFLSHSHLDKDLVKEVASFLLKQGMEVYIDWLDETMPKVTSSETATKIKDKINQCDKFIVLLTENSKNSRWVPWELGYADGKKRKDEIAIFPIKIKADSNFNGIEYMSLYPIINKMDKNPYITYYSKRNTSYLVSTWLKKTNNSLF